jgi:redox-sensitive bicupin YhaK (pirin superfamily)
MITIRKSSDRGHIDHRWLDTYHTFSFGGYYDPAHMGFRSLRVINEDVVAPGRGFAPHPHDNMEIITVILSGQLAHKDSTGSSHIIKPGDVQHMTAGTGIVHSEFNPSKDEPVHLMQIWIEPAEEGLTPSYEEATITFEDRRGRLKLLASPDAADGSVPVRQDVRLYSTILGPGQSSELGLAPGRHAWVQVLRGGITLNGRPLAAGDGAAVSDESALTFSADSDSETLVFDLA